MINELRAVITTQLSRIKVPCGINEIGYRVASDQKMYPHVIWDIDPITPTDMGRYDFIIDFNVWGKDEAKVFSIMDKIDWLLRFYNIPNNKILPTFYTMSMGTVDDPDKTLVHGVVRVQCQVYEVDASNDNILNPVIAS